jgi:hypothetical protein
MAYFDNLDDYQAARESGLYGADGKPLAGPGLLGKRVEIVRSVSRKLNLGNYESVDFFCSLKASCDESEQDQVSADLTEWCYDQIRDDIRKVKEAQARREAGRERSAA